MDSDQIRRKLRRLPMFDEVYPSDQLPRRRIAKPTLLIANTDGSGKPGQHWVAIYVQGDGYGELFDSLASRPIRKPFKAFMNSQCRKRWITNEAQLQSAVSRFCAHYCVLYCILRSRGFDVERITRSFKRNDTGLNDVLVHGLVCDNRTRV